MTAAWAPIKSQAATLTRTTVESLTSACAPPTTRRLRASWTAVAVTAGHRGAFRSRAIASTVEGIMRAQAISATIGRPPCDSTRRLTKSCCSTQGSTPAPMCTVADQGILVYGPFGHQSTQRGNAMILAIRILLKLIRRYQAQQQTTRF